MAGYYFIAIFTIAIAWIVNLVVIQHAYNIAKELGEKPPASGLVFGFVEGYFWQRIREISDDKQSVLLKRSYFIIGY